jgi:spermidine/putrescine transport system ATP-binding protein
MEADRRWIIHNTKNASVGDVLGMNIFPEDIHIMRKVSENE